MNGRVYDYNVGRFMSVDPFVHGGSQGINPYSYIMNNPLAGTDPTGYAPDCDASGVVCYEPPKDKNSICKFSSTECNATGWSSRPSKDSTGENGEDSPQNSTPAESAADIENEESKNDNFSTNGNSSNKSITFGQFFDSIDSMMNEYDKKMQALAEEMNENSASFVSGLIDGAASVPKAYYRANLAAADAYGLNGEAKETQFRLRTRLFDLTANKFIHDSEFREQVISAIRSYHAEAFDAFSLIDDSKRSYILGRFTGRMGVMRKLNMQQKSAIYLGDFYHGVTRAGDGIAVLPERLVMGDLILEVQQNE